MNNFKKLLEKKDSKEKLLSTISFEVEIPLSNYSDKGTLQKKYAARDLKTPIELAKSRILKVLKLKKLPLNINIIAVFEKQNSINTIFTISVDGIEEKSLMKILSDIND